MTPWPAGIVACRACLDWMLQPNTKSRFWSKKKLNFCSAKFCLASRWVPEIFFKFFFNIATVIGGNRGGVMDLFLGRNRWCHVAEAGLLHTFAALLRLGVLVHADHLALTRKRCKGVPHVTGFLFESLRAQHWNISVGWDRRAGVAKATIAPLECFVHHNWICVMIRWITKNRNSAGTSATVLVYF